MNKALSSLLKILVFAGLGILLFWLVVRGMNFQLIATNLENADYKWIPLIVVIGFISNVNRSIRWNMLLKPLGYRPRFINTFCAVIIGYFANLGLPRLGEVSRCAILNRYEKIPMDKSLGTVFTERVIDVITLFVCLLIVLLFEFDRVNKIVGEFILNPLANKFNAFANNSNTFYVIVLTAFLLSITTIYIGWRYLRNTIFYTKLMNLLKGFAEGIASVRRIEKPWLFLFHTISLWTMYWLMAYVTFKTLGFTYHLNLGVGFVVMVFGAFGFAAPVQGGFGVFHFIVSQTLVQYNIALENGLSYAILSHATQTLIVILFGLIALIFLPIINRKKEFIHETPATGAE